MDLHFESDLVNRSLELSSPHTIYDKELRVNLEIHEDISEVEHMTL